MSSSSSQPLTGWDSGGGGGDEDNKENSSKLHATLPAPVPPESITARLSATHDVLREAGHGPMLLQATETQQERSLRPVQTVDDNPSFSPACSASLPPPPHTTLTRFRVSSVLADETVSMLCDLFWSLLLQQQAGIQSRRGSIDSSFGSLGVMSKRGSINGDDGGLFKQSSSGSVSMEIESVSKDLWYEFYERLAYALLGTGSIHLFDRQHAAQEMDKALEATREMRVWWRKELLKARWSAAAVDPHFSRMQAEMAEAAASLTSSSSSSSSAKPHTNCRGREEGSKDDGGSDGMDQQLQEADLQIFLLHIVNDWLVSLQAETVAQLFGRLFACIAKQHRGYRVPYVWRNLEDVSPCQMDDEDDHDIASPATAAAASNKMLPLTSVWRAARFASKQLEGRRPKATPKGDPESSMRALSSFPEAAGDDTQPTPIVQTTNYIPGLDLKNRQVLVHPDVLAASKKGIDAHLDQLAARKALALEALAGEPNETEDPADYDHDPTSLVSRSSSATATSRSLSIVPVNPPAVAANGGTWATPWNNQDALGAAGGDVGDSRLQHGFVVERPVLSAAQQQELEIMEKELAHHRRAKSIELKKKKNKNKNKNKNKKRAMAKGKQSQQLATSQNQQSRLLPRPPRTAPAGASRSDFQASRNDGIGRNSQNSDYYNRRVGETDRVDREQMFMGSADFGDLGFAGPGGYQHEYEYEYQSAYDDDLDQFSVRGSLHGFNPSLNHNTNHNNSSQVYRPPLPIRPGSGGIMMAAAAGRHLGEEEDAKEIAPHVVDPQRPPWSAPGGVRGGHREQMLQTLKKQREDSARRNGAWGVRRRGLGSRGSSARHTGPLVAHRPLSARQHPNARRRPNTSGTKVKRRQRLGSKLQKQRQRRQQHQRPPTAPASVSSHAGQWRRLRPSGTSATAPRAPLRPWTSASGAKPLTMPLPRELSKRLAVHETGIGTSAGHGLGNCFVKSTAGTQAGVSFGTLGGIPVAVSLSATHSRSKYGPGTGGAQPVVHRPVPLLNPSHPNAELNPFHARHRQVEQQVRIQEQERKGLVGHGRNFNLPPPQQTSHVVIPSQNSSELPGMVLWPTPKPLLPEDCGPDPGLVRPAQPGSVRRLRRMQNARVNITSRLAQAVAGIQHRAHAVAADSWKRRVAAFQEAQQPTVPRDPWLETHFAQGAPPSSASSYSSLHQQHHHHRAPPRRRPEHAGTTAAAAGTFASVFLTSGNGEEENDNVGADERQQPPLSRLQQYQAEIEFEQAQAQAREREQEQMRRKYMSSAAASADNTSMLMGKEEDEEDEDDFAAAREPEYPENVDMDQRLLHQYAIRTSNRFQHEMERTLFIRATVESRLGTGTTTTMTKTATASASASVTNNNGDGVDVTNMS